MGNFDSRYVGFFERFNRQEYFEAHEVLEGLWLETTGERKDFYKGLIQTAVALLKLKQGKTDPAVRLAGRALSHLENYLPEYEGLDVTTPVTLLRELIAGRNLLGDGSSPMLELMSS